MGVLNQFADGFFKINEAGTQFLDRQRPGFPVVIWRFQSLIVNVFIQCCHLMLESFEIFLKVPGHLIQLLQFRSYTLGIIHGLCCEPNAFSYPGIWLPDA